jgi:hypothetical protein
VKSAEPKSSTSSALQRKSDSTAFFQQEGSKEAFFGSKQADTPFFQPVKTSPKPIQAKLKIGAPDDHFEKEADATADRVVQRLAEKSTTHDNPPPSTFNPPPSTVQRKCAECEQEEVQREEELSPAGEQVQMKPIFDSAAEPPPASEGGGDDEIRRKPIFESNQEESPLPLEGEQSGDIQRKCAECEAEEDSQQIQRSSETNGASDASPDVASRLQSSKGGGSPLPDDTRSEMEGAFGADFSGVRIHTGGEAEGMSNDLQAQAFTHGSDIYFNKGKYDTGSTDGKHLLAHELTHTVQQGGSVRRRPAAPEQQKEEATELTGEKPEPKKEGEIEGAPASPAPFAEPEIEEAPGAMVQAKPVITTSGAPSVQRGLWDTITNAVSNLASSIDPRQWLNRAAMNIPGFRLVTVIIGYNPIIQQDVPRTAENFIGGFLGLLGPIGNALFAKLQETNAISMAMTWLEQEVAALNITLSYIRSLIDRILDGISITDISGSISRALDILREPAQRIMRFLGRLAEKIKEFIFRGALQLVGAPVEMVMGILNRAGNILRSIFENPIGFIGNLVTAIRNGLMRFMQNIGSHLLNGLVNWLFGALQGAGLQLPQRWDLAGIFSLVMQMLNLTYQQGIRPRLVRLLGEQAVTRIEQVFEFIRDVMTRGPIAIWERIREFLSNLYEMVIGGIREFVISRIVQQGVVRLISMFNPAGALIQAVMAIWNTIQFFIERAQQIASFVNAVFESISHIASGAVGTAVNWIENSLARAIPVILGFLARFIGLGNISEQIRNIIQRIRRPIDSAIDRVVNWVAGQARRLVNAVTGRGRGNEADNRTPAQKQDDLNAAIQDVDMLIDRGTPLDEVRAQLPSLQNRYRLQSINVNLYPSGEYDITGSINPSKNSKKGNNTGQNNEDAIRLELTQLMSQFLSSLSEQTRERINRYGTVAIGILKEEDGFTYLALTTNRNRGNQEMWRVAQSMGINRLQAVPRARGRGDVGAPEDAEQLMIEEAFASDAKIIGIATSRRVCADCALGLEHESHGTVVVEVTKWF